MNEKDRKEEEKKFQKALDNYKRTTLAISRIPEKYKTRFMEIAKEEFCSDYGMCLREMIRTWDGIYTHPNEELDAKIDLMASEITNLKQQLVESTRKEEEKKLIAADGSIKRIG